jgi:HSP20 family molecular chaperone IbpA
MARIPKKIEPEVCEYMDADENSLTIEIVLPGVAKENIRLKVNTSSLLLFAAADEVNYAKYLSFCQPVVPEKGHAFFEHDLLRIKIPLRA